MQVPQNGIKFKNKNHGAHHPCRSPGFVPLTFPYPHWTTMAEPATDVCHSVEPVGRRASRQPGADRLATATAASTRRARPRAAAWGGMAPARRPRYSHASIAPHTLRDHTISRDHPTIATIVCLVQRSAVDTFTRRSLSPRSIQPTTGGVKECGGRDDDACESVGANRRRLFAPR